MSLGIVLKGLNTLHFNSKVDFFFEFVPQLIMLLALFGFMDYMIIIKWLTNFEGVEYSAPSIISNMIDMCLGMGKPSTNAAPLFSTAEKQTKIMVTLMEIVLVCIPMMLCIKPLYLGFTQKHHS